MSQAGRFEAAALATGPRNAEMKQGWIERTVLVVVDGKLRKQILNRLVGFYSKMVLLLSMGFTIPCALGTF